MSDSQRKCPSPCCQHYAAGFHHVLCPLESVERKVNIIAQLLREVDRWKAYGQKRTATIAIYQGKCAVLKHENNKLRRKLRALQPAAEPTAAPGVEER